MDFQSNEAVLEQMRWRYATKVFDPSKKIADKDWVALEETLRLAPSSYGFQPWQFLVIESPSLREQLRPHAWNQTQITDASHLVVCCSKISMSFDDVDRWLDQNAKIRNIDRSALAGFERMLMGFVSTLSQGSTTPHWTAKQAYIALGMFMAVAASMGIDTCPIEGFEPSKFDEILELVGTEYRSAVVVAAGYRSSNDKLASLPKVRYSKDEVIRHL
ncbi:MAG: NAD(P)H-dependent oxidoreductase [Pirellulales bacterium]